jgi:hypothetical protein
VGCLLLTAHTDIHKIGKASWHTEPTGELSQQKSLKYNGGTDFAVKKK